MLSEKVVEEVAKIRANSVLIDAADLGKLVSNLVFVQQLITASESLLLEAAKKAAGPLKNYFAGHWKEEQGHEAWLARDLADVGFNMEAAPLIRRAVELAGAQYYLIRHVAPECLLGYMAVLEGFPMPLATVDLLEKIHGKPLLRTLRYHAEHDLEHRKEVFRMIDANPHPGILENAVQTAISINSFLKEIA